MKTSESGIDLIKQFEGFRADAYPDPGSGGEPWTVGYGSTLTAAGEPVRKGLRVTEEEATALLAATLGRYERGVLAVITQPLLQHQFDAMVSLCYNIGAGNFSHSSVAKLFNKGLVTESANAFTLWNKAAGHEMPGLTRRRYAERAMFMGHHI